MLFTTLASAAFAAVFALVLWRPGWFVAQPRLTLTALAAVTALACIPLLRLSPFGLTLTIDP